ncbi:MAG: DUF1549 domain-containing protein, partial [Verrucomicrobiota bacterium]
MKNRLFHLTLCMTVLPLLARGAIDFEKEVFPIFEANCLKCHGPDQQKSELRVDRRALLLRGGDAGVPSIVPGQPEKSFLLEVIKGVDPEMQMPPLKGGGRPLTSKQIAIIEQWIREGAEWPGQMDEVADVKGADHWAFQPVRRVSPPARAHPVDAFLNARMKTEHLVPNPPADPRTLIRRASIVLTGLAPTPEDVQAFEKAFARTSTKAYEDLVDDLLASPHFGERWAQHWLDVIRWAESNGSESNLYRKNAWFFRDYVIRSLNKDKPYDRFLQEQIAGDIMGAGNAMGFLVSGSHVPLVTVGAEATAQRQARADRMDEIMQTIGASVMGITMSCARCHNHKFDPVSITDYYAMTAVFQDIEFGGRFPELPPDHPRRQRKADLMSEIEQHRDVLRTAGTWEEDWGSYRELHFPPV